MPDTVFKCASVMHIGRSGNCLKTFDCYCIFSPVLIKAVKINQSSKVVGQNDELKDDETVEMRGNA